MELPAEDSGRAMTLIDRDGVPVAALLHDPSLEDEPELLAAATAAAGIALENARLHVELRARLEELRGSRARMVDVANKERQRLERNLHDGAQQRLVALSLELSLLGGRAGRRHGGAGAARLGPGTRSRPRSRSSARSPGGSIPPSSAGTGSAVALEQLAALAPVPVRLAVETNGRLPEALEVAAYYLVCESLANVGKYAQASSATVDVNRENGSRAHRGDRRRGRRRRHGARQRPARHRRPRRGARRPAPDLEPGRRRHADQSGDPVRAVIAEDSVLLREGVAGVLRAADFDVVGCCETADDLMLKVRSYSPDVAIVDIRLPPTHQDEGLRAALEIRTRHPSVGVLVLSQYLEVGLALKLFAETADGAGYLLKDRISDVPEFVGRGATDRRGRLGDRSDHRLDARLASAATTTRSRL